MNAAISAPRRAAPRDVSAIRALTRAAHAKRVPLVGREPKRMTADHAEAVANPLVHLMEAGEIPVALIELVLNDDHVAIENVAVLPAYQGWGLARRLPDFAQRGGRRRAAAWRSAATRIRCLSGMSRCAVGQVVGSIAKRRSKADTSCISPSVADARRAVWRRCLREMAHRRIVLPRG
ncbi:MULTISPECIES: GNAT family N-acetyltransferase [Burkholderia]|uniref:GNAT family N-acetyltransferase n=1 Tax=Burkholderia TaxID=32008 RepID=UPI000756CEFA|nr:MULTISPECIES: GNAT family N-acetyltransferase [Burkholderia]AOJ71738.1 hypothetical protein WS78_23415 [Burkholderia savannae]KVG47762.1 hypothetical protein WS77_27995 [Burkholderia sp. MSMB0265]KVG80649.1 hypothetical protein WS81_13340 [Burkholderia sp. MSMB2040]KVG94071.1 hypothetical protein WS83_08240 [Burkholderia sp. MSMB2042]